MPLVKLSSSPKGLPSAKTVLPTWTALESPTRERVEHGVRRVDLDHGEIGGRVGAHDLAL